MESAGSGTSQKERRRGRKRETPIYTSKTRLNLQGGRNKFFLAGCTEVVDFSVFDVFVIMYA